MTNFSLVVHQDAESDLEHIWDDDDKAAAQIAAFLEQAKNDQDLMDRMNVHMRSDDDIDVSRFLEFWHRGCNLWRLKVVSGFGDNSSYRVLYAFDPRIHRYHILGIVHRNFDYDSGDSRTKRIIKEYGKLDIPRY